jgi:hypothetical protein
MITSQVLSFLSYYCTFFLEQRREKRDFFIFFIIRYQRITSFIFCLCSLFSSLYSKMYSNMHFFLKVSLKFKRLFGSLIFLWRRFFLKNHFKTPMPCAVNRAPCTDFSTFPQLSHEAKTE